MILSRGGVYLAKLNPAKESEVGKVRPVVVLTSQLILNSNPPIIFICPLSSKSQPAFSSLHLALQARDELITTSYALVEHSRSVGTHSITSNKIADLTPSEIAGIIHRLGLLIDL
jgi:mRNA interferase MazF